MPLFQTVHPTMPLLNMKQSLNMLLLLMVLLNMLLLHTVLRMEHF